MLKLSMNVLPVWGECRLYERHRGRRERDWEQPGRTKTICSHGLSYLCFPNSTFLNSFNLKRYMEGGRDRLMQSQPSHLSSFLPFFGHGQTWAIAEKKTLTGNKIFCCIQAYKLISDQRWCLLKNNQKNPIQMPPMISYQLSMYLLWARQKYTWNT